MIRNCQYELLDRAAEIYNNPTAFSEIMYGFETVLALKMWTFCYSCRYERKLSLISGIFSSLRILFTNFINEHRFLV